MVGYSSFEFYDLVLQEALLGAMLLFKLGDAGDDGFEGCSFEAVASEGGGCE